jgi:hypothetical protein
MAMKRYKAEEIVAKLRQVNVLTSQRQSMADAIRQIGVSEVTYCRWRQRHGGGNGWAMRSCSSTPTSAASRTRRSRALFNSLASVGHITAFGWHRRIDDDARQVLWFHRLSSRATDKLSWMSAIRGLSDVGLHHEQHSVG